MTLQKMVAELTRANDKEPVVRASYSLTRAQIKWIETKAKADDRSASAYLRRVIDAARAD